MYLTEVLLQCPEFKYDSCEISRILSDNYRTPEAKDFVATRIANSGIASRRFFNELEEIVKLNGLQQRSQIFDETLPTLFAQLLSKKKSVLRPDVVISTSCTVPALPAMDVGLIKNLALDYSPLRVPVYQHGCLGGVWALALANKLKAEQTLVCSFELCSLLFQAKTETATQMMGAVLFADGIGAAIISDNPKNSLLNIVASADFIIPDSTKVLGYNILDASTQLVLSPQIPSLLSTYFPSFIEAFLNSRNLNKSDIKHFLVHPGGLKILDNIKDSLLLKRQDLESSYAVLQEYGNMSSASIFFVIDHFIKLKEFSSGDYVLVLGVGPGINLELVLCQIP